MENCGASIVTFGPFQLDLRRRSLTRDKVETHLGERALDVLCALVTAGGEVVSKGDLVAKVWPGVTVEENNLQVQVYAVRRALGEDGDARGYIRTVSGRGYRFVGDPPSSATPTIPQQTLRYARAPMAFTWPTPRQVRARRWCVRPFG
jgi:DNA-binding winged helix-turn-helix (wHTH) protein